MIQKRLLQASFLFASLLAAAGQLRAQCMGPMSVSVAGSQTGLALTASETHVDALCPGVDGSATISATGGTGPYMGTGTFPQMPGTHVYTVTDANSCTTTVEVTIAVLDNTPPSITCPILNLSVLTNPGACTFTVPGTAYDPVVNDNCGIASVEYSVVSGSVSPATGASLAGAVFQAGSHTIEWKVTDLTGLMNTCQFTLEVAPCLSITGHLIWNGGSAPNPTGVGEAMVFLSGPSADSDGPTAPGLIPAGGAYELTATTNGAYTITPVKNIIDPPFYTSLLNGVDAGDATALQRHLVGLDTLTDMYRRIAGDCNKSSTLSTLDAAIIRQAVLLNPAALSILKNTRSWRFVPVETALPFIDLYTLPPFEETRFLPSLAGDISGQDFYGIKVGDVVETANPAIRPDPDAKPLVWRVRDRLLKTGQTINLDFSVENFTDLAAFQYALHFNPAQLQFEQVEIIGNSLGLDASGNFGQYNIQLGELRAVWSVAQGQTLLNYTPQFRLRFKVLDGGMKLSEALSINPASMNPVAYTSVLSPREVQLKFVDYENRRPVQDRDEDPTADLTATDFELLQNRPNPFSDRTVIGFTLPEACAAQLRVLDLSGRELLRIDKNYPAGYNEETLELRELGTSGILYYELTTPFGKLTRKMTGLGR